MCFVDLMLVDFFVGHHYGSFHQFLSELSRAVPDGPKRNRGAGVGGPRWCLLLQKPGGCKPVLFRQADASLKIREEVPGERNWVAWRCNNTVQAGCEKYQVPWQPMTAARAVEEKKPNEGRKGGGQLHNKNKNKWQNRTWCLQFKVNSHWSYVILK